MIRLFLIILLINFKTVVSHADNQKTFMCSNIEVKHAFDKHFEEITNGLNSKQKYCLAKAFIKHFNEGWLSQLLPPTPDEIAWYRKSKDRAIKTLTLTKLINNDLYKKISILSWTNVSSFS